jgi:hypothetical protein
LFFAIFFLSSGNIQTGSLITIICYFLKIMDDAIQAPLNVYLLIVQGLRPWTVQKRGLSPRRFNAPGQNPDAIAVFSSWYWYMVRPVKIMLGVVVQDFIEGYYNIF